jgi:DNA-binding NarL/FixJ family response regulator
MVPAVTNPGGDQERPQDMLTPRELEILGGLARGETNREIATELFISEHTVKIHVRHILAKLGLRNRQQAAAYAAAQGLL